MAEKRFNSQRDGILHSSDSHPLFPNPGFNSQRDGILPNDALSRERLLERFNSQRDGILLKPHHLCKIGNGVSIPNGMEFYYDQGLGFLCEFRFNSQRDGILPL